jgi:intein-encoded DNA endonuclease-like protein
VAHREQRAREISERKEQIARTESGPPQNQSSSERKEEILVVSDGRKRGEYRSRELRIKLRDRVNELRQQGRSYSEIIEIIEQEFGVVLSKSHVSYWTRGIHDPHNGRRIPSLELLEPSEALAYLIGAVLGDGYPKIKRRFRKGYRHTIIRFEAVDREFVEEVARCIAVVLNRPPPKLKMRKGTRKYFIEVESKTLWELLKKPVDLERLRKYIEHCKKCMAAFLRGFFDAEGCVLKSGYILAFNTNYEVLTYVQGLLERFGIESTGPRVSRPAGSLIKIDPITGKIYTTKKDCYCIYIRSYCNVNFYNHIGFTILRKQERLERYVVGRVLKRT